jgi:two-component sensor histidine kinase
MNTSGTRRLALRHLLAIVVVSIVFSSGALLYQVRSQYVRGIEERDVVLQSIEESYVPPVAAALFFYENRQLQLLSEGIVLLPYVEAVTVLERRSDETVPVTAVGNAGSADADATATEYPLTYEYDGDSREIGVLRVTTSMTRVREQILARIRTTTAASLVAIVAFAVVVLLIVQRMVFRHLTVITTFMRDLDPDHIGSQKLVLPRRARGSAPDELDEIADATNMMISRLERALSEKTTLLHELYHRTGNMLQSVRSILFLQSSSVEKTNSLKRSFALWTTGFLQWRWYTRHSTSGAACPVSTWKNTSLN